jgi:FkbM family methyltransferase
MPTRMAPGTPAGAFNNACYSQLGEDQVVDHFFSVVRPIAKGVYVDVGCHHPIKFSNTYLLYEKGWRGLCVDADASMNKLYAELRPEDQFVAMGVGDVAENRTFYEFENAAANTFDPLTKESFLRKGWKLRNQREVQIDRLDSILRRCKVIDIDYLNIDVEGLDHQTLGSFDFRIVKPWLISIETNCRDLSQLSSSPAAQLLAPLGYYAYSHCVITSFFALKQR